MLRFDDYREITAKYAGAGCDGKHTVKAGDTVGYAKPRRRGPAFIVCEECWREWSFENRDAASMESGFGPAMY